MYLASQLVHCHSGCTVETIDDLSTVDSGNGYSTSVTAALCTVYCTSRYPHPLQLIFTSFLHGVYGCVCVSKEASIAMQVPGCTHISHVSWTSGDAFELSQVVDELNQDILN